LGKNNLMLNITACIVLYRNDRAILQKAIESFLNTDLSVKLYLIDNSPTNQLKDIRKDDRVEYVFNNANTGFGAGHNIAIKKSLILGSKFHLVLNPDVEFERGTLEKTIEFLENNPNVGLVAPKTVYPDGSIQYLCRMLPTPFDFFLKRIIPKIMLPLFKERSDQYEFIGRDYDKIMEVPFLSGCCMFIRSAVFKEIGVFDEKIFMYTEDIDLCRRVAEKYKTVYFPEVQITHGYERGSAKELNLLLISIKSAMYYFNKWGWIWDKKRDEINRRALNQFK
jgi:GT2 family glycosyltransferase